MNFEVKCEMKHGDLCPYCQQVLHVENGVFECGGEGEGICSIWSAIYDFGLAVKRGLPRTFHIEQWIDDWLADFIGQSWTEAGWDRSLHLHGVRETWNLDRGCKKSAPNGVV